MAVYRHFSGLPDLMTALAAIGFAELHTRMTRADHRDPRRALPADSPPRT